MFNRPTELRIHTNHILRGFYLSYSLLGDEYHNCIGAGLFHTLRRLEQIRPSEAKNTLLLAI